MYSAYLCLKISFCEKSMQWHNYAREYISSQREIKTGGWRDSTPRLLQVLIHSIYFSPKTLRGFSGLGLSIGVKIPRKTVTLYSDVISPELVQEETLTESLIEQDQGRRVQITMRSLFSLLYPHPCYRNVSDCKIFLAAVDKKQKMHKVYEALLDLDYLLGPGQNYIAALSPIRSGSQQTAYTSLSVVTDISRASPIAQSHAVALALSIRSIYPTQEILSRFPKDLMMKLDRLIDFSPISKQDLFSKPEKCIAAEQSGPNTIVQSADIEAPHTSQLRAQVDSGAHSITLPILSAHAKPRGPELVPASPYANTSEINLSAPSNLPPSTPLSYTNIGANPLATSQHHTLRQPSLLTNIFQRSHAQSTMPKMDATNLTQLLIQNYIVQEAAIYLSIVSAFKAKNIEKLLSIFGFSPNFVPQDSITSHTVSQYINFPLDINSVSYSASLCASINDAPLLMQQNVRMVLTQTDQHYNSILNLLMQAFPSTMLMGEMNPLRLFPSLGNLNTVERSELVTERLKPKVLSSGKDNDSSESNTSGLSTESKYTMTLTEILDYILSTFLDRLSDLLIPVKGRESALHDTGLFNYNPNVYGITPDPSSGSYHISSEAFNLLCELLDIRNNIFFQRTVVLVLFNSELEYPSLIASGLQSDDSIFYFPLPYNNTEQSYIDIENTLRFVGLYLAFLHKALHITNLFSNCKTEEGSFEQFAAFYNEGKNKSSVFEEDIGLKNPFSEGNQLPRASLQISTGNDTETPVEGVKGQKVSLTSVLFNLKNFNGNGVRQEPLSQHRYQNNFTTTRISSSFSLQAILDELGYDGGWTSTEDGRGIYISELGDINMYRIPAIASVMQKSIHALLLVSPDDAHSSTIYRLFSSYNQNVFPYSSSEELPMFISDKTHLGSVLSKGVKLLRACASLADITLTTLHPAVLYPVPVTSAAHAEVFDEACIEGARATALGLIAQMVTCIAKGSISDILSTKDTSYERLFGTPAWLAIMQCYCSGTLSQLRLLTSSMSNQHSLHSAALLNDKGFQNTPTNGNNAVSLAFGPLTMSTPVRENLTSTLGLCATGAVESPLQTDLASSIALRLIKTLELVINQAIKTYLRAQSVIPLVAMVVHAEVLPSEKILRAPLYLIYPLSKDRNKLQEISRLLLSETSTTTPPTETLKLDEKRNLFLAKHASNRSILCQENYATKDLLLSRHILVEHNVESKTPKRARSKEKKTKIIIDKKHSTVVCWESISIGQYIADSYVEASNFLDVQLQIMIGGVPIKDNKKGKTLTLKTLRILNAWRTVDIASTNPFLCALRTYKCTYNHTYYHFIKQNDTPIPSIEYCTPLAGDEYRWYTTPSSTQENHTVESNEKLSHHRSMSTKRSSTKITEQVSVTSTKAPSISATANQGSIIKKSKLYESNTELSIKQSKPQVVILTESSTVDDCREMSYGDSTCQIVRGWKSTFPEEKTSSEVQSCSVSASTIDIHNMANYTGASTVPDTTILQNLESTGATLDGKLPPTSTPGSTMSTKVPRSKRLNMQVSIRRSNIRTTREARQRANSTIGDDNLRGDSSTCFVTTHNPEQPCQIPVSDEYIKEQYLHTFIGVNTKTNDIIVRPEISLQPYIRLPSSSTSNGSKEILKYIPSELVKKCAPMSSSKAAYDHLQREIRITSKKPLVVQLDQLSEPIVAQAVSIKKSTNDVVLFGIFSPLSNN